MLEVKHIFVPKQNIYKCYAKTDANNLFITNYDTIMRDYMFDYPINTLIDSLHSRLNVNCLAVYSSK